MASGSSSTIRVLSRSGIRLERNDQVDPKAASVSLPIPDVRASVKAGGKALADIAQADALTRLWRTTAIGIVLHRQMEGLAVGLRPEGKRHGSAASRHPVLDSILDQRLQDHAGDRRVFQRFRYIDHHGQAFGKTDSLDI